MGNFWDSFKGFFTGLFEKVFGESPEEAVHRIADVVSDELAGLARNIAAAGIKDGAGLLLELKRINAEQQAAGGTGAQKKLAYTKAAEAAWAAFGGDMQSAALTTALDFGSVVFHQKDVADEIGAPKL